MRVGGACDDVDHVLVTGEDTRQGPNHALKSLVWRQQAKGEQYKLFCIGESIPGTLRLHEGQVGNAVRHQIDLFPRHSKYISQNTRRVLAHHNKTIRERGDLLHDNELIGIWLTENRV